MCLGNQQELANNNKDNLSTSHGSTVSLLQSVVYRDLVALVNLRLRLCGDFQMGN